LTNQSKPLISAIIPTRNRCGLLKRAVDSVLNQTWEPLEIVVVDDASGDNTEHLLKKISAKSKLRYFRNSSPKGAAASRNIAIEHARGEYIAGLDDDDTWHPERTEKLLNAFEERFSAVCSYDRMKSESYGRIWKKKHIITLDDLLFYNRVGNQVLTKRDYLMEIGGYDESLPSAQDYDLWIRLAEKFGPVKTVPEALQTIYLDETNERISNSEKKVSGYKKCYEKHRHLMNDQQTRYQEYRLRLAEGRKAGWIEILRNAPPSLYFQEIKRKLFL